MNEKVKTRILEVVNYRHPNWVRMYILLRDLSEFDEDTIKNTLKELCEGDKAILLSQDGKAFRLSARGSVPIRRTIKVGDVEVPRQVDVENLATLREDINDAVQALARYSDSLEKRFEKMIEQQMQSYWANIITLFGLFIGLFSLIISFGGKFAIDSSWSYGKIFWVNLMQILPLAVVLWDVCMGSEENIQIRSWGSSACQPSCFGEI